MNRPNPDQKRWNQKYLEKGFDLFGKSPSAWLSDHESLLKAQEKGKALDLACGVGRNSFYLAQLGFEVEAVDISDVVIDWLQKQVSQEKAAVSPQLMDLERESLPQEKYQVILNFNYLERRLFSAMKDALVPGGILFFETAYHDDIELLGSTMNPQYVLDYNELLHAFLDLRILEYREKITYAQDLGKEKALASLIARKI